jgi:xylulokinase
MGEVVALGIDLGLSGVRAAVVRSDGVVLGTGRRSSGVIRQRGRAQDDPATWIARIEQAAGDALRQAASPTLAVIGVGAYGPTPVLIDERLEPLTPALLFSLDRRCDAVRREVLAETGLEERQLTPDHPIPKLEWWRREHPDIWRRAAYAVDATGFIVGALIGEPTMDVITALDYSAPGLPAPIATPRPREPMSVAGRVRPGSARAVPNLAGVPVAVGTYDSYVDLAGIGVLNAGDCGWLLGTTLVGARVDVNDAAAAPGLHAVPYGNGRSLVCAYTASSGSILDWLATLVGPASAAGLSERAARLEPGAGALLVVSHFDGERSPGWDARARGVIAGLTTRTSLDELYRGAIDAVALSARVQAELLFPEGDGGRLWIVAGGGVRNQAWLQATADATGATLAVSRAAGSAAAAGLFGLRAIGVRVQVPIDREIRPEPRRYARFGELLALQRRLWQSAAPTVYDLGSLEDS